jgi:hypothetical protein
MFDAAAFDAESFDESSFELDVAANDGSFDSGAFDLDAFDEGSFLSETALPDTDVLFVGAFLESSTTLALYFSDIVEIGSGGSDGIVTSLSGGPVTWAYSSGEGSLRLVYTASRTIGHNEYGTGSYTNPGNGIEDQTGNDIENTTFVICNRIPFVPRTRPYRQRRRWFW